jgi:hypothetical protein
MKGGIGIANAIETILGAVKGARRRSELKNVFDCQYTK